MPNFERSSLNQKLTLISLLTTATALLFVFVAFAVTSVVNGRQAEAMQLASFARVIGAASAADLMLVDRGNASGTLAALDAQRGISAAVLYDRFGRPLAAYGSKARADAVLQALDSVAPEALERSNREGRRLLARYMRVMQEVRHGDIVVGVVMIEADSLPMWIDIVASLSVIGLAMGASLLVSLGLAGSLKRSIVEPVACLIQAAQKVSASQNYGLRVPHQRRDELGTLIDSFNTMLAQIEDRGAALLHHRDELKRQVGVRTEQLEKAKNAAEAASRAKSGFLATMSHEIRTPMNGVLGMTEMLLATELSEAQRNYTTLVKRSGEHLLVIINDILDFSKIEAGKLTIEYINFNLWDLLDDIHNVYTPQAANKGLGFDFDIANDIPVAICGDPNRLRQILANLLGNAIKFTENGRIMARVRVAGEDAQKVELRFEVHDTGIGISREARARIFDAFSQADDSTTRKFGGTGLGLAISKQLVELMKGAIGVENAQQRGSIFWFTLAFDKRRVDPDAPGHQAHTLGGLRVLVVEEQDASRDDLVHQLEAWSASCDGVASANTAFERLVGAARAGKPYDAALLDMELAQTSGLALAAAIRAEPLARGTHLILLSPERLAADPVQRREAGVAYQLVKPARAADLYACLAVRAARLHGPAAASPAPASPVSAQAPAARAQTGPRRARRVLLAEDNPVNVEVARAMLESLGLETQCARNGEEALSAVQEGGWDVVLMDCQMPVMDGFAATSEIRRHERELGRARTLPVIAITANALQGDREACLAAGMDDYLSKPFTQQQLAAVMRRWVALPPPGSAPAPGLADEMALEVAPAMPAPSLPAAARPQAAPAPAFAAPVEQPDAVNRSALDNIRSLSRDSGDALVHKVVTAYMGDTPRHLHALRQALGGLDAESVRRVAHSLKSSSANIGAARLATLCRELEQLGRAGSVDGAAPLLYDMEREFVSVRQSLHALLEKES